MAHTIFMTAFYSVLTVVVVTVAFALWRSLRSMPKADEIRWHADFHDLPPADRVCRHVLTGEFRSRQCPNAFDCRVCETHAKMPAARLASDPEAEIYGMEFPLDRFYHRGHTWVKSEDDGTVTIGLDELGKRIVGPPDSIELPEPGDRVHANGVAFRLKRREANVRILSPVDGEVVATGCPREGWYLKVRPEGPMTHLLRGAEVRPWVMREIERLQLALVAEGAQATLADGGVPVDDIAANYPSTDWDAVCGEIFLEP